MHLGARVDQNLVDLSARTGYSLIKAKPKTDQERAAEYYQVCQPCGVAYKLNLTFYPNLISLTGSTRKLLKNRH